jgi:hypothetical protein
MAFINTISVKINIKYCITAEYINIYIYIYIYIPGAFSFCINRCILLISIQWIQ